MVFRCFQKLHLDQLVPHQKSPPNPHWLTHTHKKKTHISMYSLKAASRQMLQSPPFWTSMLSPFFASEAYPSNAARPSQSSSFALFHPTTSKAYLSNVASIELLSDAARASRLSNLIFFHPTTGKAFPSEAVSIEHLPYLLLCKCEPVKSVTMSTLDGARYDTANHWLTLAVVV